MKPDTHPAYGPVAFRDRATGTLLLTSSTLVAREGRVQAFERRYGKRGTPR